MWGAFAPVLWTGCKRSSILVKKWPLKMEYFRSIKNGIAVL